MDGKIGIYDDFASEYADMVNAREEKGIEQDPIMPLFLKILGDVFDYRGFLRTLGSVAKSGGRLVLSMNNPYSFVVRSHITDYFESGKKCSYRGMAEEGVKVYYYQHTLEEYMDACLAAGFQLQRLVDVPTPEGAFKRRSDTLLPLGYHFPFFMILSFIKI